jgi:hypothetical protein
MDRELELAPQRPVLVLGARATMAPLQALSGVLGQLGRTRREGAWAGPVEMILLSKCYARANGDSSSPFIGDCYDATHRHIAVGTGLGSVVHHMRQIEQAPNRSLSRCLDLSRCLNRCLH